MLHIDANLEAVIFDLDDTLHDDSATYRRAARRVAEDVSAERGVDADALHAEYVREAEQFWRSLSSERLSTPLRDTRYTLWSRALQAVGIDDDAETRRCVEAYNTYRKDAVELFPGALELLDWLRARGTKLALITNGFAETHREKLALLRLERAFDTVLIADEVGMLKPEARIFLLAAERLGVAPNRCAMVGDRFERDIVGGHAVGMFTIWTNVRSEPIPHSGIQPGAVVPDIAGVRAVLEAHLAESIASR